jgi:hypothetical protein
MTYADCDIFNDIFNHLIPISSQKITRNFIAIIKPFIGKVSWNKVEPHVLLYIKFMLSVLIAKIVLLRPRTV